MYIHSNSKATTTPLHVVYMHRYVCTIPFHVSYRGSMQCFAKAREQLRCTGSDIFLLQKTTVCHKCKCTLFQQILLNTHCHQFSPSFHAPAPISDEALTLIMYSTPASSPVRIVELAGGETERGVELIHDSVSLVLYSTSYSVMGNSL